MTGEPVRPGSGDEEGGTAETVRGYAWRVMNGQANGGQGVPRGILWP